MSNQYLRAFVIGSCFFVIFPFFYVVSTFKKEQFNFSYLPYTFLAPPTLGLMNVISLIVANKFNLTRRMRYLLTSLIAPTLVACGIIIRKVYNYSREEWIDHLTKLYIFYFFIFNVIVYTLDKYV